MIVATLLIFCALVFALAVSFFYSGSETAVISASRYRLDHMRQEGDRGAEKTLNLLADPNRVISAILIGTNLGNVFAVLLFKYGIGQIWPSVRNPAIGLVHWDELISLLLLTPTIIVFAEILPKALFRARADDWITELRWPLTASIRAFAPVILVLDGIVNSIVRRLDSDATDHPRRLTRSDLIMMLHGIREQNGREKNAESDNEASSSNGSEKAEEPDVEATERILEPDERRIIGNIIALEQRQAREIMQPLVELETVNLRQSNLRSFLDLARECGHSRFPAYRDRIVDLIGYVDVYDVIRDDQARTDLAAFVQPAYYVPETKRVDDLLQEFLQLRINNAIVVDEYGGCSGWITREDIIEEIVGELEDELDRPMVTMEEIAEGHFRVEGRTDIEDLNEVLETTFDDSDCDTIGGFVMRELGRVPKVGDRVSLEGWIIEVSEMDLMRVAMLEVRREEG